MLSLTLSLSHSHSLTLPHTLSLTPSLSHTHTHTGAGGRPATLRLAVAYSSLAPAEGRQAAAQEASPPEGAMALAAAAGEPLERVEGAHVVVSHPQQKLLENYTFPSKTTSFPPKNLHSVPYILNA